MDVPFLQVPREDTKKKSFAVSASRQVGGVVKFCSLAHKGLWAKTQPLLWTENKLAPWSAVLMLLQLFMGERVDAARHCIWQLVRINGL